MATAMPLDLTPAAAPVETAVVADDNPVEKFFADRGIAPLDDEELLVFPLGDLSQLPPEFRAGIEAGEADVRAGRVVPHAEVQRRLEEKRQRRT